MEYQISLKTIIRKTLIWIFSVKNQTFLGFLFKIFQTSSEVLKMYVIANWFKRLFLDKNKNFENHYIKSLQRSVIVWVIVILIGLST